MVHPTFQDAQDSRFMSIVVGYHRLLSPLPHFDCIMHVYLFDFYIFYVIFFCSSQAELVAAAPSHPCSASNGG